MPATTAASRPSAHRASNGDRSPNGGHPSNGDRSPNGDRPDRPTSTPGDRDLDALQSREAWAVRKWIYGERDFIERVLIHYDVPMQDVSEHAQEVFHQAIRSLPTFRGGSKVSTWLYSIARHVAFRAARDRKRYVLMAPQDIVQAEASAERMHDLMASGLQGPDAQTSRRERKDLVRRAMRELPPHYEEVICLRDLDEQTTAETAGQIGITEVNVRVRLHRARKMLRDLLAPYLGARA